MRATTTRSARPRSAGGLRTPVAVAVVACLALTTSGSLAGTAYGAPGSPPDLPAGTPSRADVEDTQQQAGRAAGAVAATEAELEAANAELEAAAVAAEQAAEAANGARWQLEQATEDLTLARRDARRAETEVAQQRDAIAGLAVAGYEGAGDLSSLDAAFGAEGPEGVMGRLPSYEGASTSMEAGYQQFAATSALAQTFRDRAAEEKQRSEDLAAAARAATDEAEQTPPSAGPTDQSHPAPAPAAPQPTVTTPPPTASGADRAIDFALAQVGEPYLWAAAGPSSWDCSGLTMAAWARGGRSLPHYSVAQYTESTPISSSQLRPGDLVFWGSSSSVGSIHHVALYIGGGQIVHAPRTGRDVTVESMYYWIPTNFFARV